MEETAGDAKRKRMLPVLPGRKSERERFDAILRRLALPRKVDGQFAAAGGEQGRGRQPGGDGQGTHPSCVNFHHLLRAGSGEWGRIREAARRRAGSFVQRRIPRAEGDGARVAPAPPPMVELPTGRPILCTAALKPPGGSSCRSLKSAALPLVAKWSFTAMPPPIPPVVKPNAAGRGRFMRGGTEPRSRS